MKEFKIKEFKNFKSNQKDFGKLKELRENKEKKEKDNEAVRKMIADHAVAKNKKYKKKKQELDKSLSETLDKNLIFGFVYFMRSFVIQKQLILEIGETRDKEFIKRSAECIALFNQMMEVLRPEEQKDMIIGVLLALYKGQKKYFLDNLQDKDITEKQLKEFVPTLMKKEKFSELVEALKVAKNSYKNDSLTKSKKFSRDTLALDNVALFMNDKPKAWTNINNNNLNNPRRSNKSFLANSKRVQKNNNNNNKDSDSDSDNLIIGSGSGSDSDSSRNSSQSSLTKDQVKKELFSRRAFNFLEMMCLSSAGNSGELDDADKKILEKKLKNLKGLLDISEKIQNALSQGDNKHSRKELESKLVKDCQEKIVKHYNILSSTMESLTKKGVKLQSFAVDNKEFAGKMQEDLKQFFMRISSLEKAQNTPQGGRFL